MSGCGWRSRRWLFPLGFGMECASADRGQPWLDFSSRLAWASSLWLASVTEDKALGFPSHCRWEPGTVGVTSTTFGQPKLSDQARPESRGLEKWTSLVRRRRRGVRMGEPTRREGRKTTAVFTSVTHSSGVTRPRGVRECSHARQLRSPLPASSHSCLI